MKYPKQIIIPGFLHEPSIEYRMIEMKTQDDMDNDAHYTNKQYREFATESYLANHDDYIKLAKDIHKENLESIRIMLMNYEEELHQSENVDPRTITKIENLLTYLHLF